MAEKILQLETATAPIPESELVTAFCSQNGLQQGTLVEAVWSHLMSVYLDCSVVTFRLIILECRVGSWSSFMLPGSQHTVQLSTGSVLENLKGIETELRASEGLSSKGCCLQAEAEIHGDQLLALFTVDPSIPNSILLDITQVGISEICLNVKHLCRY
jgi:hypothetical protein